MQDKLQIIHDAAMRILARTGIQFHHPDAIEILKDNGIRVEGETAYFTEEQVMNFVRKAPSKFTMYAQNPKYNVEIGGGETAIAPGSGSPSITKPNGAVVDGTMEDYIRAIKILEYNPEFKISGGKIVHPSDVPPEHSVALMLYATLLYSEKCIYAGTGRYKVVQMLMDILAAYYGGYENIIEKPRIVCPVNPITPLQYDDAMLETLITYAKYGQPFAVSSVGMTGVTSPVTLAGTMALANAEILAGIAFAQMVRPGTPVLYGMQSTGADMRSGAIAIGSPESAICYKHCALMGKFYGLPSRGGGGITDAKVADMQAGYETMMVLSTAFQNNISLVLQGCGIVSGFGSFSFEKMIGDFEILNYIKRMMREPVFNEETLAEDLIDELGAGGVYLVEDHTLENFRDELYTPIIGVRGVTEKPTTQLSDNITDYINKAISNYNQHELDSERVEKVREVLLSNGVPIEAIKLAEQR